MIVSFQCSSEQVNGRHHKSIQSCMLECAEALVRHMRLAGTRKSRGQEK